MSVRDRSRSGGDLSSENGATADTFSEVSTLSAPRRVRGDLRVRGALKSPRASRLASVPLAGHRVREDATKPRLNLLSKALVTEPCSQSTDCHGCVEPIQLCNTVSVHTALMD